MSEMYGRLNAKTGEMEYWMPFEGETPTSDYRPCYETYDAVPEGKRRDDCIWQSGAWTEDSDGYHRHWTVKVNEQTDSSSGE